MKHPLFVVLIPKVYKTRFRCIEGALWNAKVLRSLAGCQGAVGPLGKYVEENTCNR